MHGKTLSGFYGLGGLYLAGFCLLEPWDFALHGVLRDMAWQSCVLSFCFLGRYCFDDIDMKYYSFQLHVYGRECNITKPLDEQSLGIEWRQIIEAYATVFNFEL